jgi:hypothetical protein
MIVVPGGNKSCRDGERVSAYHIVLDQTLRRLAMRKGIVRAVTGSALGVFFATAAFAAPPAAPPAAKLAPADIQSTFFNGQPFTATSPSSIRFKMTFTPDGKIKRVPIGKGNRGEGTWKLSKDGFCTAWKEGKDSCFTLVSVGDKKWTVLKGSTIMATWSK